MKKIRKIASGLLVVLMIGCLSGCGIVKIIPKGTEAEYTGVVEFDASAEAAGDWANVLGEITEKAVDFAEGAAEAKSDNPVAVKFTATVNEYVEKANGLKCSYVLGIEGVSDTVEMQMGTNYSGTAIRDSQSFKVYGDFTNQTEWSEYATTLNAEVQNNVVAPLGDISALEGKTLDVVGVVVPSGGKLVVTPVAITVQ